MLEVFNEEAIVMRSEPNMESAKIYQFPVGGRSGFKGFRKDAGDSTQTAATQLPRVDFDCWYHQEAILESAETDKPHN